jgi:integrase
MTRMRRPWNRKPTKTSKGEPRYAVGYRNHEGAECTRTFTSEAKRDKWVKRYEDAERENRLKEFLLGPDPDPGALTVEHLLLDWFAHDADPILSGGLARSTFDSLRAVASRHILGNLKDNRGNIVGHVPYGIGAVPAAELETAGRIRRWLDDMRAASVSEPTVKRAWTVLSSAQSWAVERDDYPNQANGCKLIDRNRTRRRSSRSGRRASQRGGAGSGKADGRRQRNLAAWALSPVAVELIRVRLLERPKAMPILALRDATFVSAQYQLACRNQEIWGLIWSGIHWENIDLLEVLSNGEIEEGKTSGSKRSVPTPRLLWGDFEGWKVALGKAGFPTGPDDFVFPGDLAREGHGHSAGHMTKNQAKKWGGRSFTRAARAVEKEYPREHPIGEATPYSLRRGGISLRIRAGEDRQVIAKDCGTSVEVIDRHYSFAIEDLRHSGPRPAEVEREAARKAVFAS